MNLNLALVEENRRDWIIVLRINGRDFLVKRRLAHARHAQYTPHDMQTSGTSRELRSHVVFKHRLQLARRTRQQYNRGALMIDEHPRRGAVWIRQNFRVFNHHRLARIALRHRHSKTPKALPNLCQHNLVKQEPPPESTRGDLARDVVFGWTKSACGDYHFRAPDSIFDCFFEAGGGVAPAPPLVVFYSGTATCFVYGES